ncbi:formamidopyrimidine-DNA glycosylase [Paenibacillus sp. DS2015]|uniref:Fpg/Nei family DNA glycosylase n=1 Tax=Paenibacillus sp. DS2015 TaxID=3373917 RepID=UPI003D25F6BD
MPELPEMENYRRVLSNHILDIPISDIKVNRDKSINVPVETFASALIGNRVIFVERRGKYLNFHMSNGTRLLIHLMLGGLMYYGTDEDLPERSTQVEISFGDYKLCFIGLRLGYIHLLSAKEVDQVFSELGPEPLDRRMNEERFVKIAKKRRGGLKTMIVNQHVVAGIGNRYADEIAYRANLLPSAKIQDLGDEALQRLYSSVVEVLTEAIEDGGYMDTPIYKDDQQTGRYKAKFKVYDREGETCYHCGGVVSRVELTGRKAFFCPSCQHDQ